jgi:hypothetical protein
MAVNEVATGTVGDVNFAAAAAVGFINPLGAQIDAFLGATLGPFQAELQAQLQANIDVGIGLGLSITNPFASLEAVLIAIANLQAAISAGLTLPAIQLNAELTANADLIAGLEIKLGILDLAVQALLNIKIPALGLAADATAALAGPGVVLLEMTPNTLAAHGAEINNLFGVTGITGIAPGDTGVVGYILVAKTPGIKASFDFIFQGI